MRSIIVPLVASLLMVAICGELHTWEEANDEIERVDLAGETALEFQYCPRRQFDRPPDILQAPEVIVASTPMPGGRRAELSVAKCDIRFARDSKQIESYKARISLFVVSPSGEKERVFKESLLQWPMHEMTPADPHDFQLVRGSTGLLGFAYVDNGLLFFAEVDPHFVKEFPNLRGESKSNGIFLSRGKNYYGEVFSPSAYLPNRTVGNRMYSDVPLKSLIYENGKWSISVLFEGKLQNLQRLSVGNWRHSHEVLTVK